MNKYDFFEKIQVEPATQEIVSLVEEKTGKTISFIPNNNLQVDATVKIARKSMPQHIIYFKGEHSNFISYLIAHECGHILRVMSVSEEKRLVPASSEKNKKYALAEIKKDLPRFFKELPDGALDKFLDIFIDGLIRQLTNLPVDYRIEKWLYSDYPSLRAMQKKFLDKSLKLAVNSLSKKIKQITPPLVFVKSNLMNYAYAKAIDSIFGMNYSSFYVDLPNLNLGEKLYEYLLGEDKGFLQDITIINSWANLLELKEWFQWINFEDIPRDYLINIK